MKTNKVISYIKQQLSITNLISLTKQYSYIKSHNLTRKINYTSAIIFSLLALAVIFPLSKGEQTTEAVDGTASTTDPSLSIVFSSTTASVDLRPESANGTFKSSTESNTDIKFSVPAGNYYGYQLFISSTDDIGELKGANNPSNTLESIGDLVTIGGSITEERFKEDSSLNGYWGYKPSKINSANNSNYLPSPTTVETLLDKTTSSNTTANEYTIAIGVRADYSTPEDTYITKLNLKVLINPTLYSITYDKNTTDNVTSMPKNQSGATNNNAINLANDVPIREGYEFGGWCTTVPSSSTPATCTGNTYQPSTAHKLDLTSSNTITLYAMWKEVITYLQNYTLAKCQEEATTEPSTITDFRDKNTYTVRYIEGNCWMTQNLRLAPGTEITNENSNIPTTTYTVPSGSTFTANNFTIDAAICSDNTDYGCYYNYKVATAGTISGSNNNNEAEYDICPKGWKLPSLSEQKTLTDNSTAWSTTNVEAFSPVKSGYYNNTYLYNSNQYGYWWSTTNRGTPSGLRFFMQYSYQGLLAAYNNTNLYRGNGMSIRCILNQSS
ncbi:MAG: FISUMP domain-containing protein [Candidatus Saccharibacteria bacterium]|nr:FISUMP domain-containing protein [Candidatus Saccharibacteria bacterium]